MQEWPLTGLNLQRVRESGWRATPMNQFVLKLVGPCNLACDYCYVYTGADLSWRERPVTMSRAVLEATAGRIADHAREHALRGVSIVLHGGEPLMAGAELLAEAAVIMRESVPSSVTVSISVQTNGVLLDNRILDVCRDHRLRIGISLDGDQVHHDAHRRYQDGRGSYEPTVAGLRRLLAPAYRDLFSGLLCTINLSNDPLTVYDSLLRFDPPVIDFLLPHGTWSSPPPGRQADTKTPYADWLITIFNRWATAPTSEVEVRLFTEIIRVILTGTSRSDQVGLTPAAYLVIDTDGSMQQVDILKVAYPGAAETGLTVLEHPIEAVFDHPAIVARQLGIDGLSATCRACRLARTCGGGHYTHRYRPGTGFLNPSVYCADLEALFDHVAASLT